MWQGTCPLGPENVPDDDDNENDDGDDDDDDDDEIMKIMMTMLTSSKSARPECESSREKARSSPLMGSEHTQYTPDHQPDHHHGGCSCWQWWWWWRWGQWSPCRWQVCHITLWKYICRKDENTAKTRRGPCLVLSYLAGWALKAFSTLVGWSWENAIMMMMVMMMLIIMMMMLMIKLWFRNFDL